ncbi:butyrophilin subfamily 1 member A1-like isoform X2 [Ascaphus truei]|uniref:butyrophilin subfamily 1 member A1-like isoform X2 n=1 Tax=Ascaphus truei TaxID=8439 RepID=UPI003F5AD7E2
MYICECVYMCVCVCVCVCTYVSVCMHVYMTSLVLSRFESRPFNGHCIMSPNPSRLFQLVTVISLTCVPRRPVTCADWLWVSTNPTPVTACLGRDALLRCIFSVGSPPLDLGRLSVRWRRGTSTVLEFAGEPRNLSAQRDGASLSLTELEKGNASLTLSNMMARDAGNYTCEIRYLTHTQQSGVDLRLCGGGSSSKSHLNTSWWSSLNMNPQRIRKAVIIGLFAWLFGVSLVAVMMWCRGSH